MIFGFREGIILDSQEALTVKSGEDMTVKGSEMSAEDVYLKAGKDIYILSAENRSTTREKENSSSASLGGNIGGSGLTGIRASYGRGREEGKSEEISHTESNIKADHTLSLESGRDTILKGSRIEREKVQADAGGSLSMESEQDRKTYRESGKNTGIYLGYNISSGKVSGFVSAGKSRTDSDYESVTNQAGIYAGDKGFDISVKDNTHLKGAVMDSKGSVDKNTLRTGTLSWEDIENKADYTSGGSGISYTAKLGGNVNNDTPSSRENSRYDKEPGTNTHNESDKVTRAGDENRIPLNERGLLGVPTAATKGKADSTTKAAMAPGKIVITDTKNQKQDVTGLDRNTRDSLNKLKAIFDKTKAEERKQLVEEMSIVGNEAIHELAARNGWGEGSIEKTALHGLLGAMTSKAAGSSALAGILSGGVQEYAMGYLHNHMPKGWAANHPDEAQMIAAGLGMIVGSISNDKKIGGYITQMGAKWNIFGMELTEEEKQQADEFFEGIASKITNLSDEDRNHLNEILKDAINDKSLGALIRLARWTIEHYGGELKNIGYDADKAYGGLQFLSKIAFWIDFAQYLQKYFNFQVDRYNDLESRYQAQGRQFSVEIYNLIKSDTNQAMD